MKNPFKPDQIVVAVESFVQQLGPEQGDNFAVKRGARLRGDHQCVKAHPEFFVADGADDLEIAQAQARVEQEAELRRTKPLEVSAPQAKPIAIEDQFIAIRQTGMIGAQVPVVRADGEPMGCLMGEIVSRNTELYKKNRQNFIAVRPEGLAAEDAVVALADLTQHNRDGSRPRVVFKGQWLRFDDPLVAIHGPLFERPLRALDLVAGYGPD